VKIFFFSRTHSVIVRGGTWRTLAIGGAATGRKTAGRVKLHLKKQLNLQKLAESYNSITPRDYLLRTQVVLKDDY